MWGRRCGEPLPSAAAAGRRRALPGAAASLHAALATAALASAALAAATQPAAASSGSRPAGGCTTTRGCTADDGAARVVGGALGLGLVGVAAGGSAAEASVRRLAARWLQR